MADDLGDEWWNNEDKDSADENVNNKETDIKEKRKRKSDKIENNAEEDGEKKKKKKRKKKRKAEESCNSVETAEMLWEYFEKELEKTLTKIELDDLKPETDEWFRLAEGDDKNTLSSFLCAVAPKFKKAVSKNNDVIGSPSLLIVTSSAVRAVELLRSAKEFTEESQCKTVKLFAKHLKVSEQMEKLEKTVHLGVGTPNRMLKLIDNGSLRLKKLKYVIIDWYWLDVKKRSISTMPDVKDDFVKLFSNHILPRCKKKKTFVACY